MLGDMYEATMAWCFKKPCSSREPVRASDHRASIWSEKPARVWETNTAAGPAGPAGSPTLACSSPLGHTAGILLEDRRSRLGAFVAFALVPGMSFLAHAPKLQGHSCMRSIKRRLKRVPWGCQRRFLMVSRFLFTRAFIRTLATAKRICRAAW